MLKNIFSRSEVQTTLEFLLVYCIHSDVKNMACNFFFFLSFFYQFDHNNNTSYKTVGFRLTGLMKRSANKIDRGLPDDQILGRSNQKRIQIYVINFQK